MNRRTFLAGAATFAAGGVGGWLGSQRLDGDGETLDAACDCPTPADQRHYEADLIEVVDGDTVDLRVDLGLATLKEVRVRIAPIDTAEFDGDEQLAREQTAFVRDLLTDADRLVFRSAEEKGGFGRWLGDVNADGVWLSDAVLERWPDATYDG